ncbi:hypothetical protein IAR55_006059 [Kwoniella newhampshirensis]|uniref:alpha-amylase n=1 Tax=Kwoniella newhampshirensis TaxID=1651941 RepID=A0AAW0YG27_9TREE
MGFDTVWISPVVANVESPSGHESYHGYWASNIYKLNPHFGTPEDLKSLSTALHARGMYLMVDVVANHVGTLSRSSFSPGTNYGPFTSSADFHPFCVPDWDDQWDVENCWLSEHMPDLNTESPRVISALHHWIQDLVKVFEIDALRIDTVKHIRKDFWPGFVKAAGVVAMGEVLHGEPTYVAPYQRESMSSLLDFAVFFHVRRAFTDPLGSISELLNMINTVHRLFPDPTALGSFLDNHDFPRFAGMTHNTMLIKNAMVYPFVNDGVPILYMGGEHSLTGGDDPFNREAIWLHGYDQTSINYQLVRTLNAARRSAAASHPSFHTTLSRPYQLDNHTIAIGKPPLLSIMTNYGSHSPTIGLHLTAQQTGYKPLLPVIDVLTNQIFSTDPRGGLTIALVDGEPRVFLPLSVHRGIVNQDSWQSTKLDLDTSTKLQSNSPMGSPGSPRNHLKRPSLVGVMSWFSSGGRSSSGGKSNMVREDL